MGFEIRLNNRPASTDFGQPKVLSKKSYNIGHYIVSDTIGQGNFGKVKLGTHVLTGEKVAVKIFNKSKIKDELDLIRINQEIDILKYLRHPNLIQLFETVENSTNIYLVMELASKGDLLDFIIQNRKLSESQARRYFQDIIKAVEELHRLKIYHRDLKPKNILIDENLNLKVVDFGLSVRQDHDRLLKTLCGSPSYLAPEILAGNQYQGAKADIWSCGVILFVMICGYLPFDDKNIKTLYSKIINGNFYFPK